MKRLQEYINENRINEGLLGNILKGVSNFLSKKFKLSGNAGKDLQEKINKENDALNKEISKVSKGKIKDLQTWWKFYTVKNKNASKVTSPIVFSQNIMKNTKNVSMIFSKLVETYKEAGILNNTIICAFIRCIVNQYICIVESIIKDNSANLQIANQLNKIHKIFINVDVSDNKDAEKIIKEVQKSLNGKANELISKYKK